MRVYLLLISLLFSIQACSTTDQVKDEDAASAETSLSGEGEGASIVGDNGAYAAQKQYGMAGEDLAAFAPIPGSDQNERAHDRVFFNYDSAALTEEAQHELKLQADWLASHSDVRATIEGHCDERGTREYNLALGEKRANAAKNYLVAQGVDSSRLSVISYGKERPANFSDTETGHSKNRRAVTVLNNYQQ
jgi:peptidoglycan-associated lipoprotein